MIRFGVVFVSLVSLSLSGCFFYLDDDDDPCDFGGATPDGDQAFEGRQNPFTGECEAFGGPTWPCNDECGPCPGSALEAPLEDDPRATWAFCPSECSGLNEATCLETSACRGIYNEAGGYEDCWGTDLSGPIQGGDCRGLDAYECSRHDDCVAIHFSPCGVDEAFEEPGVPSCELADFVRCDNENNPGDCYGEVECDGVPPECPPDSMPGIANGCWTGYCIPVDQCEDQPACADITEEHSCIARTDCAPQYVGVDCTCDANGCTCADHIFDACSEVATDPA